MGEVLMILLCKAIQKIKLMLEMKYIFEIYWLVENN